MHRYSFFNCLIINIFSYVKKIFLLGFISLITSLSCNRNDERVSHIDEVKKENIRLSKDFKIVLSQRISGRNTTNNPLENIRSENGEEYKLPSNFSNTTDGIIKYSFEDKRYTYMNLILNI